MSLDLANLIGGAKLESVLRCKICGKVFEKTHRGGCTCQQYNVDKDIYTKIMSAIGSFNDIKNQMPLHKGRMNRIAFFQYRLDALSRFYYTHITGLKFRAERTKIESARKEIQSLVDEYRKFENSTDRKLKREILFLKRHISSIVMKDFEHSDVFNISVSINLEKK